MSQAIMPTYGRLAVEFDRGNGQWLWDTSGKKYLDGLGGLAVNVLGHTHPKVVETIREQAGKLIHTSNLYGIQKQSELAERLVELSGLDNMFFGNSGAEANEAALKIARAYGNNRGVSSPTVIVVEGSFHGRTLGTLSATGNPKIHSGFYPLVEGFQHVPYDDLDAIEAYAANKNVVAVMVEPILGEGGVVVPKDGYLRSLRTFCDRNNWLLILDEIQTGMGRTGRWFASQHESVVPDVMTLAKGLANGIPIGVCLARGEAAEVLHAGMHGSTFGGNPFSCAVACTVIDVIEEEGLVDNAAAMGQRLRNNIANGLTGPHKPVSIRGKGMMVGVELNVPCGELVSMALSRGGLINVTAECVVRMLPGLNMSANEVDQLSEIIIDCVVALHNQ